MKGLLEVVTAFLAGAACGASVFKFGWHAAAPPEATGHLAPPQRLPPPPRRAA